MKPVSVPTRLIDDGPRALRDLLELAGGDDPTPAELSEVAARLGLDAPLPAPDASSAPANVAGQGATSWLTAKVISLTVGAVVATGAISVPLARQTVRVKDARSAPAVTVAPPIESSSPQPSSAPPAKATQRRPAGVRHQVKESVVPAASLETEASLLRSAAESLAKADFAGALQLTARHAAEFPSPLFAEEREAIGLEALARLGRVSEFEKRLEAFDVSFPRSAHRARLRRLAPE